ncbi:MAG: quinoprotein relay system zinc metallohydrolase 2 [Paracoccus sp. (in: a-proteobacteria)]|nr:quinoprotein relay system zinc metallohydrolase 2 [Paracoccus sp. (in: a-proteobacteria)]
MVFHLIVNVCLAASAGDCAPVLLPAGDAATQQACMTASQRIADDWLKDRRDLTRGVIDCVANADLPAAPLQEIAPGVHVHLGDPVQMEQSADGRIANLGVIEGRDSVAVIDAGVSRAEGQAMYVAIRRLTDKPVSHLVLTHMHPDHVLGAEVMVEAGASIVAHHAMSQGLQMRGGTYLESQHRLFPPAEWIATRVALPDMAVKDSTRIDLGGRQIMLAAWPTAHTDNDLTALDLRTGTLFTGDLIFRDLTPVVDGSLLGWLSWLQAEPAGDVRLIVPGHGNPTDSWAAAQGPISDYLKALATATRDRITQGVPMSKAVPLIADDLQSFENSWNSFDMTVARDATAAYKELEWE